MKIEMKVAIMQPYFFPYIGYWQMINAVDKFILFDDVNYINRGWINRNLILINNEPKYINLYLDKASQNKLINEISILDNDNIKRKFLKTIEISYIKAPYFNQVYPIIEKIMYVNSKNLSLFLENSINKVCEYLLINTEIIKSSTLHNNKLLKNQEKIIDICNNINADCYINAIGGQGLYDYDRFEKENITLKFLSSKSYVYKQFKQEFIPNLSIIDIMMFNNRDNIKFILDSFEVITSKKEK